jgi:hypothetical protein
MRAFLLYRHRIRKEAQARMLAERHGMQADMPHSTVHELVIGDDSPTIH